MVDLNNLTSTPCFNEDSRRKIVDVTERVKAFTIADMDGLKLGNHYHRKTPELFYVVDGKVHFKLEDIETKQRQEYSVEPGQEINMPLLVAHLVLPERRARFISVLGNDFDPDDLIAYKIEW